MYIGVYTRCDVYIVCISVQINTSPNEIFKFSHALFCKNCADLLFPCNADLQSWALVSLQYPLNPKPKLRTILWDQGHN